MASFNADLIIILIIRYLTFGANNLTIFLFVERMNQYYVGVNSHGANDRYTIETIS
jgi:hypothetical protein